MTTSELDHLIKHLRVTARAAGWSVTKVQSGDPGQFILGLEKGRLQASLTLGHTE